MGELNNNVNVSGVTLTVSAPQAGAAMLEFDLIGFQTLDGTNCCTDTLTLTVNGAQSFTGAWTHDEHFSTFFTNPSQATYGPFQIANIGSRFAHTRTFEVPVILNEGPNTFEWSYSPLQSFSDEAWGIDNVVVAADCGIP